MEENTVKKLLDIALEARKMSYSPYSSFSVGAALLCKNGKIYTGCNIESASYSPTNCAERTAFFKAVSEGEREFEAIAVVGGKSNEEIQDFAPPCGVCRQVMMDFCSPEEFKIILMNGKKEIKIMSLSEMLPLGFGPSHLR